MNAHLMKKLLGIGLAAALLTGCATKTVVVPKHHHAHNHGHKHVVYKVRPAKKVCWRHHGHWDCK